MDLIETYFDILNYLKDFVIDSLPGINLSFITMIIFIIFIALAIRTIRILLKSIVVGMSSAVFAFLLNSYMDYGWTGFELLKNMTVFGLIGIAIYVVYEKIIFMYKGTKIIYKILKIPIRICRYIGDFIISSIVFLITKPLGLQSRQRAYRPVKKYSKRKKKHRHNNNEYHEFKE